MSQELSYTAEELAALLKISKLTVYELIKKGELTAYRVGKQMRVDASDLEAYKLRAKRQLRGDAPAAPRPVRTSEPLALDASLQMQASSGIASPRTLVITGQDIGLDLLARQIESRLPQLRPLRSQAGSLDSLIAMYRGEADLVSLHLLDGDTGEYNIPYVRRLLVGFPCLVVRLLSRQAGLFTAPGNPKGIRGWTDLGRTDVRIVNRERGAGARVLLDEQLRLNGIEASRVAGYPIEETNHLAVAGKVAAGEADTGVGIEKAAALVGVGFVPLIREQYDLVMLRTPANIGWIESVLELIRSDTFRKELGAVSGYDLSETGRIVWEA